MAQFRSCRVNSKSIAQTKKNKRGVNKKKYLPNGQQVESHRELHVVIVRKNPQGQCKADLMYYVEIFENGKYNPEGKVTGPVSYIGMPGGYLPCEKAAAFKSKLAK